LMKIINNSLPGPMRLFFVILFAGILSVQPVSARDWYNSNWNNRVPVTISNSTPGDLTDFQVKITLNSTFAFTNAVADGSDIRVAAADGTTLIPFWIEEWNPEGKTASIWVKVPDIPVSGTRVYIYYGNPSIPPPEPVETPPAGPFTRAAGNPIVPIGAGTNIRLLAENMVYDPVTQHYWMCLSNYSSPGIALCYSDDPTNPASWIWHGNVVTTFTYFYSGAPHLANHNGTWYLFYADKPDIMVATSSDPGGPYTINQTPVLQPTAPTGAWDSFRVDEPYVFQHTDGKWIMIYMADAGDYTEQVGYATADNIAGPYTAFEGNPVISFGEQGSYDAGTIADPWVYEYHGTYYIGYASSSTKSSPWQTALAITTDWVNFTKHGVILPTSGTADDRANSFRGAVTRIGDEYVFSYTNDTYRMAIATQPVFSVPPASTGIINNPDEVFDFYDGFDGTSVDWLKWNIKNGLTSQATVNGGWLTLNATSRYIRINGTKDFGSNYITETRAYHPDQGTDGMIAEVGLCLPASLSHTVRILDGGQSTIFWRKQAKDGGGDDIFENMAQRSDKDWHIFRVFRQGTGTLSAGFQIDDNPWEGTSLPVPDDDLSPFLMSYGSTNDFVVDWTRVRKWAGADPSTVVGNEETLRPLSTDRNNAANLRIWASSGRVIIQGVLNHRSTCEIFDIRGNKVVKTYLEGNEINTVDMPAGSRGVYVVRVTDGLHVTIRKVAVM
jgi:hypothetical protein